MERRGHARKIPQTMKDAKHVLRIKKKEKYDRNEKQWRTMVITTALIAWVALE